MARNITLKTEFQSVRSCDCGGVVYSWKEEILFLTGLSREQYAEFRKSIHAGNSLDEALKPHYASLAIYTESLIHSLCEKCRKERYEPVRGGP